jgi:hypothetical protein
MVSKRTNVIQKTDELIPSALRCRVLYAVSSLSDFHEISRIFNLEGVSICLDESLLFFVWFEEQARPL